MSIHKSCGSVSELGKKYVDAVLHPSIAHYGIKGQKHGVRRFQNEDGSLTPAGEARYLVGDDRQASASNSASPFANTRIGTKRTEQPAAAQSTKVAVAVPADVVQRGKQLQEEKEQKEKEARAKENGYEPETMDVADKLEKSGFNFKKYKNADGSTWEREDLEAVVDQAVYNLKSTDYSSDEANMESLINLYDLDKEDAAAIVKAAKEHSGGSEKEKNYEKGTEDVSAALKDPKNPNSVNFNKYMDKPWFSNGGVEGMADEVLFNVKKDDYNRSEVADYLKNDYEMDADDAEKVLNAAEKTAGKSQKKTAAPPVGTSADRRKSSGENTVRRLLVRNRTGRR